MQELPIYEPGLDEVVKAARDRNLFFSTDTHKHVAEGDIIFVRYCTPCLSHPSPLSATEGCGVAAGQQPGVRRVRSSVLRGRKGPPAEALVYGTLLPSHPRRSCQLREQRAAN